MGIFITLAVFTEYIYIFFYKMGITIIKKVLS